MVHDMYKQLIVLRTSDECQQCAAICSAVVKRKASYPHLNIKVASIETVEDCDVAWLPLSWRITVHSTAHLDEAAVLTILEQREAARAKQVARWQEVIQTKGQSNG